MTLHLSPASILARNKAKQKLWREQHPERMRAFHAKYNAKESTKERKAQWARENRDRLNARRRELYRTAQDQTAQTDNAPTGEMESFEQ